MNSRDFENSLRKSGRLYFRHMDLRHLLQGSDFSKDGIIKRAVAQGSLIRVRRGLYVLSEVFSGKKVHPYELSQYICGPSFISLESAFSYYGLIPEAVYTTTCVTTLRNRQFETHYGIYNYKRVPEKNFIAFVDRLSDSEKTFLIASPWRALTDYVYCYKKNWNSTEDMESDLRLDISELPSVSVEILKDLIEYYKSERVKKFVTDILVEFTDDN